MEKNTKEKKAKGITLISLIVTIIVIIIIATVAISLSINSDGLLNRASEAKEITNKNSLIEQIQLEIQLALVETKGTIDSHKIKEILEKYGEIERANLVVNGDKILIEDLLGSYSNKRIPEHAICGYWGNWANTEYYTPLKLSDVSQEYSIINIAFGRGNDIGDGSITFELNEYLSEVLNYQEEEFKKDIGKLQGQGRKVLLSIGGSESKNINITNEEQANNFANSVIEIINEYHFNGIDIDIESGNIEPDYFEQAILKISDYYASNIMVTLNASASGMRSADINNGIDNTWYQVAKQLNDIFSIISIRYYNSGTQRGYDYDEVYSREQGHISFITALATKQLEDTNFQHKQIGICILGWDQPQGDGLPQAYLEPEDIVKAIDSLITGKNLEEEYKNFIPPRAYPELGPITIWSINYDAYNNYQMAKTIDAYFK